MRAVTTGLALLLATSAYAAEAPKAAPAKATAKPAGSAKTIKEITIEGEVKLPEVLFITSRDVERPLDWLDAYARAETDAAAAAKDGPVRVHVVPAQPTAEADVSPASVSSTTASPAAAPESTNAPSVAPTPTPPAPAVERR
ncbi:MAG: hypothetical protein U0167_09130 [bacterium]